MSDYSVLVQALEKVAEAVVEELGRHLNVSWASNRGIFGYPWTTFGTSRCRRQRSSFSPLDVAENRMGIVRAGKFEVPDPFGGFRRKGS